MSSLIISYEESEVGRARYRAGIQMLADLVLEEIARREKAELGNKTCVAPVDSLTLSEIA